MTLLELILVLMIIANILHMIYLLISIKMEGKKDECNSETVMDNIDDKRG